MRFAGLVLLLLALPAFAQKVPPDGVMRFHGYAYDLATNAYIYTEVHAQRIENGRWTGGTIRYFAPDGTPMGAKTLDFTEDEFVPRYALELSDGYYEAITSAKGPIAMERRNRPERPLERGSVARPAAVTADSGFHAYIRARFQELLDGRTIKFQLVVPGALDSFKFRIRRIEDTRFDGREAVRFRVEPDTLLRFVTDPLELTYDPVEMALLEFRGISNVHDPRTGKQYTARIAFPSTPPPDAPKNLPPLE